MSIQAIEVYVRENVLVASAILTVFMFAIFILNISTYIRKNGFRRTLWIDAAAGIAAFTLGVFMRSCWVSVLLWAYAHGDKLSIRLLQGLWWIDIVAGSMTVIGGVCCIRVFTPDSWNYYPNGNLRPFLTRPWVVAGLITLLGVALSALSFPIGA